MYGGSGKLGRGGGGGGRGGGGSNSNSKRNNHHHSSYPPPPLHRSIPPQSNRLSIGGGVRNRQPNNTKGPVPAQPTPTTTTTEENFNLVSGDPPLAFAMIIRLAPNLVDEIRRVEAEGGTAKIKFDPNANNPVENVIDVGGKDFRFTWSHEPGDLCDIYEERKSGENGNGLLVESGGAWRKLNVQRVLDESMKNHVKMRSEEAERKLKSRRAIVLDHGNPSTAAGDGRIASKPRNEPPLKKRKVEPVQASGGQSKSVYKPGLSSTTTFKGRPSVSPVPSPPEQSRPSASPLGRGNLWKSQRTSEDVTASNVTSKEETLNTTKEIGNRVVHAAAPPGNKEHPSRPDLRCLLITLLKENPKGLNFKALEKAIGDPTMKIKPILEKVATYQAPGRYILKEGVELESLKKAFPDGGSSPEFIPDQTEHLDKDSPDKLDHHPQLNSQIEAAKFGEKIDNQYNSSDLVVDKKASDHHTEEHAGTSVESGSDSDSSSDSESDSSDSGSQSRSRSKSKSPAKSGSGSSDSESDGSSSNKQGSDVDVDIMTSEDEKEQTEHKIKSHDEVLSSSPFQTESQNKLSGLNEDIQVGHEYSAVGFSKEFANVGDEDEPVDIIGSSPLGENVRPSQTMTPVSADRDRQRESQQFFPGYFDNQRHNKNDGVDLKNYDSSERISSSVIKSDKHYEKSESARRLEGGSSAQPLNSRRNTEAMFVQSPNYVSPNRATQEFSKERTRQAMDRVGDATPDMTSQRNFGPSMHGRSNLDAQLSSQRYADHRATGNAPDMTERLKKSVPGRGYKSSGRGPGFQDESDGSTFRTTHTYDKFVADKDKVNKEALDEEHAYGNSLNKDVREGVLGNKKSGLSKSQHRRQGEQAEKSKDIGHTTNSHLAGFPKDDSRVDGPVVNGRGSLLRRELSDLEMGEFREPIHREDNQVSMKKFEKKKSFKQSESISNVPYQLNSDSNIGRAAPKMNHESRKQSSPDSGAGFSGYQDDLYWKRNVEDNIEESTRPQQVISAPDVHQFPTDDHTDSEVGYELTKPANGGPKARKKETHKSQGVVSQSNGSTFRKASDNGNQQHDNQNEHQKSSPKTVKENKSGKSNSGLLLKNKDPALTENNSIRQKRRGFSPDDDTCVYFKYEKEEPELKGPIKDFSQYKQFAEEFREKYDSYCSINKIIEANRIDFKKLGHDLELAKHRDMEEYHRILEQLRENYRHCGRTHKRLKKIFVVLHEELACLKKIIKDFAVTYTKD